MPLIECTTRREGGTIVEFGDVEYHFRPAPGREPRTAPHVCEVADPDAADRFLSIPDYRLVTDPARRADSGAEVARAAEAAAAAAGLRAQAEAAAAEIARRAAEATTEIPADLRTDTAPAPSFHPAGDLPEGVAGASLEAMTLDQLRSYAEMLGMKVHSQMGAPKLRANILAHLDARAEEEAA